MGEDDHHLSDEDFPIEEATPDETIQYLGEHLDGAFALMMAGGLEANLEDMLTAVCRPLSNTMRAKIFDGYGPLSQFSAKIDIAYIFELIDKTTYDDLRAIKDIRNKFAHTTSYVLFSNEHIDRECQKLSGWKKDHDNRLLFENRCIACNDVVTARAKAARDRGRPLSPD
ncbi:hypothetical protein ACE103_20075 [Bradyrhizobium sp. ma5]|uniref:hypothetical protein n=1 Tax=Bradyrhizobium sp. ma5 TaxID=3344828 RepID=UPI0035D47454